MKAKWKQFSIIGLILVISMITGIIEASFIFYPMFFLAVVSLTTIIPGMIGYDLPKFNRRTGYIILGILTYITVYVLFYFVTKRINIFPYFLDDFPGLEDPKISIGIIIVFIIGGIFGKWYVNKDIDEANSITAESKLPITVNFVHRGLRYSYVIFFLFVSVMTIIFWKGMADAIFPAVILIAWFLMQYYRVSFTGNQIVSGIGAFTSKQELSEIEKFRIVNGKVALMYLKNGKKKDCTGYLFGGKPVQKLIRHIADNKIFENEIVENPELTGLFSSSGDDKS